MQIKTWKIQYLENLIQANLLVKWIKLKNRVARCIKMSDFQFTPLRLYHLQKTKKKRTKTEKCQIEFYFSSEFWSKIWVNLTIFDISQYSHANGHSEDTKLMTWFLFLIFYKNLTRGIGKFETIGNAYFYFFFYKIYRQDLCNFIK
jgi:hypothetical protein